MNKFAEIPVYVVDSITNPQDADDVRDGDWSAPKRFPGYHRGRSAEWCVYRVLRPHDRTLFVVAKDKVRPTGDGTCIVNVVTAGSAMAGHLLGDIGNELEQMTWDSFTG